MIGILKKVGYDCQVFRLRLGYTQEDVAKSLGYTVQNISAFENGKVNNIIILLWYIQHGFHCEGYHGEVKS